MDGEGFDSVVTDEHILLEVSERMRRREECGKPMLVYLKKDIEKDLEKYCRGNRSSIINRLLRLGLDSLIKAKSNTT